ncbi:MAG TPA: DUF3592 domain-containing protein [Isosphaeraceae bacterium]|jgi:hypothetical protein|nr:DUF3592 domain-containing protein [Isosphaeraceae bacterium]
MTDDSGLSPIVKIWVVICGLMFMVSAPISGYLLWTRYRESRSSADWPTTAGVIRRAEVREINLGLHHSFRPEVEYTYLVGNNPLPFTGTRIRPLPQEYTKPAEAQKELSGLVAGRPVHVFYRPDDPSKSVLRPGAGFPEYAVLGVPFIMFAMGVGSMLVLFLTRR